MSKSIVKIRDPFVLNFIKPIDNNLVRAALADSNLLIDTYDPVSQTSTYPMTAGTALTYSQTGSGIFFESEDTTQSDT